MKSVCTLLLLLLVQSAAFAGHWSETKTNKWDQHIRLESNGWYVAYGKQVTVRDQAQFGSAVITDVLGGGGGNTSAWISNFINEQTNALLVNAAQAGLNLTRDELRSLFRTGGNNFAFRGLDVDCGVLVNEYSEVHHLDIWGHKERQEIGQPPEYEIYFRFKIAGRQMTSPSAVATEESRPWWRNQQTILLKTVHGRIAIATHQDENWLVKQQTEQDMGQDGGWCRLTLIPLGGNDVQLKTVHGRYLTATHQDENWVIKQQTEQGTPADGGWSRFTVVPLGGDEILLRSVHGRYVMATHQDENWVLRQQAPGNIGSNGGWCRLMVVRGR